MDSKIQFRDAVGLSKPIELLLWLEEPPLTVRLGAHADGGGAIGCRAQSQAECIAGL
jgi:hypothetical protein